MAHQYAQIAFTESGREVQQELGSRAGYAGFDEGEDTNHMLSQREADFINARDSFYMASVSETVRFYLGGQFTRWRRWASFNHFCHSASQPFPVRALPAMSS